MKLLERIRKRPLTIANNASMKDKDASLDDFKSNDVIFGTRGNGGNSTFIKRLEDTADLYRSLSKFEKMDYISKIIAEWNGRFFMLRADGSFYLVRDSSPSSKLYTSVRRMMNYVVKKKSTSSNAYTSLSHRKGIEKETSAAKRRPIRLNTEVRQNSSISPTAISDFRGFDGLEHEAIHTLLSLTTECL